MSGTVILGYDCTTDPFPLQATPVDSAQIATLTVIATNATAEAVTLEGISITIPTGLDTDAAALTADSGKIEPVSPDGWQPATKSSNDSLVTFTFLPVPGNGSVAVDASVVFTFKQIKVVSTPGTFTLTVTEGSNGCTSPDCPTVDFVLSKFPQTFGPIEFWLDSYTVDPGGSTTVHWNGPSGATYGLEFYVPGSGIVNVDLSSNYGQYPQVGAPPLSLNQTTTFTLQVDKSIGDVGYHAHMQQTVTVTTPAPIIDEFSASIQVNDDETSVVFTWVTRYATYCTLGSDATQLSASSPEGGYAVRLTTARPATYTLSATNAAGVTTTSAALEVTWAANLSLAVPNAAGLALSADGDTLYVSTGRQQTVIAVDAHALTAIGQPCSVGNFAAETKAMPDGSVAVLGFGSTGIATLAYVMLLAPTKDSNNPLSLAATSDPLAQRPSALAVTSQNQILVTCTAGGGQSMGLWMLPTVGGSGFQPNMQMVIELPATFYGNQDIDTYLSDIAVAPDGSRAYVAYPSAIMAYDLTANPINSVGSALALRSPASSVALSPDGKKLYAALPDSNVVVPVDVIASSSSPLKADTPIPADGAAMLALTPDGCTLFVLCGMSGSSRMYIVDVTETPTILAGPIALPDYSESIMVPPGPLRLLFTAFGDSSNPGGVYTLSRTVTAGVVAPAAGAAAH